MATSKPKRSEKELRAEAIKAITPILQAHTGMTAVKIRPELRKAFPFGPKATDREKRVFDDVLMEVTTELEKMARNLIPVVLVVACLSGLPSFAQESTDPVQAPPAVTAKKEPFSVRHPKIWKHYRKARKFAIKTKPWVDYAGSCAQVSYSIVQFFVR